MSEIRIHEHEQGGQAIYHWQILDERGNEFSHSAYHTDRAACEAEARERLEQAREENWID
jgi:hypothetical protein